MLRDREAFGVFILSTSTMETCGSTGAAAAVCLSARLCGWWFCLGAEPASAGRWWKSRFKLCWPGPFLEVHILSLSLSLSPPILYSFALQSSCAVVKLFFSVLVKTRLIAL